MEPYVITFLGNKEVADEKAVLKALVYALETYFDVSLEEAENTHLVFYCGGYGRFSQIASDAVDILREKYPHIKAEKLFITPYVTPIYLKTLKYMKEFYDEIIYPPLETVPPQYVIARRNQWMIDHCDLMVTYMRNPYGNTKKNVDYAIRKGTPVLYIEESGPRNEFASCSDRNWRL